MTDTNRKRFQVKSIYADTIAEAHFFGCKEIWENGYELITEDGEKTIESPHPVALCIGYPMKEPMVSSFNNYNSETRGALQSYVDQLTVMPNYLPQHRAEYYYVERIMDYPVFKDGKMTECGSKDGFNQYNWVIKYLAETPDTRRAKISLRVPSIDCNSHDPPCLTTMQFMLRDNLLHMYCDFRSHDFMSGIGNNLYGLAHFQKMAVDDINGCLSMMNKPTTVEMGTLNTMSISSHIYFKRDKSEVDKFRMSLNSFYNKCPIY